MSAAVAAALAALAVAAGCRQIAGVEPITYTDAGSATTSCTNTTLVMTSNSTLDLLTVSNGFVATSVENGAASASTGIVDCPVGGFCAQPTNILSLGFTQSFGSYGAGSSLAYTLKQSDGGSVHSIAFDGGGDQVLLSGLSEPIWAAVAGPRTFWVDDGLMGLPAKVHCIGCGASDTVWMNTPSSTAGLFADANNVYVIADPDGTATTIDVYGCGVTAPCGTTPRVVIAGLDATNFFLGNPIPYAVAFFASDGTNVYASDDANSIIRIDQSNTQSPVITGIAAVAIAADGQTGDLFFADENGRIARTKADGTGTPTTLSTCDTNSAVDWLAFDATNVYALVYSSDGSSSVYAIKRN